MAFEFLSVKDALLHQLHVKLYVELHLFVITFDAFQLCCSVLLTCHDECFHMQVETWFNNTSDL